MANGRSPRRANVDLSRVPGGFVALPWSVLDCAAYASLSHPARALLLEIARQYVRDNNGRLLASRACLAKRGWKSADVIHRAKTELLEAGFIFQTVQGHRPNKASWYALTWRTLDWHTDYDAGAKETFVRGAYQLKAEPQKKSLSPSDGTERPAIVPAHGTEKVRTVPPDGAIRGTFEHLPVPSDGHHLDLTSAVRVFDAGTCSAPTVHNKRHAQSKRTPTGRKQSPGRPLIGSESQYETQ